MRTRSCAPMARRPVDERGPLLRSALKVLVVAGCLFPVPRSLRILVPRWVGFNLRRRAGVTHGNGKRREPKASTVNSRVALDILVDRYWVALGKIDHTLGNSDLCRQVSDVISDHYKEYKKLSRSPIKDGPGRPQTNFPDARVVLVRALLLAALPEAAVVYRLGAAPTVVVGMVGMVAERLRVEDTASADLLMADHEGVQGLLVDCVRWLAKRYNEIKKPKELMVLLPKEMRHLPPTGYLRTSRVIDVVVAQLWNIPPERVRRIHATTLAKEK